MLNIYSRTWVKSRVGFEQALNSNNVSWSILSICGMPNISGLNSQSTGLPPSDWKIIQALRFLCSDAVSEYLSMQMVLYGKNIWWRHRRWWWKHALQFSWWYLKWFWGGVNRVWRWFIRRRLCGAQLPSFIYWWCIHTRSSVKVKRDIGRIGGLGGGGVESNLPSRRGWTRSYFNFNSGGCNFILRPTLLILEPPSR